MPPKKAKKEKAPASEPSSLNMMDLIKARLAANAKEKEIMSARAQLPLDFERLRGLKEDAYQAMTVVTVELTETKEDQNDVYYYLHKKLDDNYDIIRKLEHQQLSEEMQVSDVKRTRARVLENENAISLKLERVRSRTRLKNAHNEASLHSARPLFTHVCVDIRVAHTCVWRRGRLARMGTLRRSRLTRGS